MSGGFHCDRCGLCCRKVGRFEFMKAFDRGDGVCKYLNENNLCSIYETRPTICNVDELYEKFYRDKISREGWYRLQYEGCRKLKEELANDGQNGLLRGAASGQRRN